MKTCPRCNSTIEDTCRFCPNCGASQIIIAAPGAGPEAEMPELPPPGQPVPPPMAPAPAFAAPGVLRPAVVSGLVMGGLSALPVLNACCCLWMVAGGMLASYLYMQQGAAGLGMSSTDGAKVGLVAGFFGFVSGFAIFLFVQGVMLADRGPFARRFREHLQDVITRQGDVPPETRRFLDWLATPGGTAFFAVFTITAFFFAFLLLGTLGGMLGAHIFGKRPRTTTV